MNALIIVCLACVAYASASGIGLGAGAIVAGPSGVVTGLGPIGPVGIGAGAVLGAHGGVLAGPALGLGVAPLGLGLAGGAITNGGGAIGVSGAGASVIGPPTAPVVVAGPAGKIAADGLWGPTLAGGHGIWG